jgi:hypothetical protein
MPGTGGVLLAPVAVLVALAVGAGVARSPVVVLLGTAVLVLGAAIAVHPPLAAYLLIAVTPLVAGIDRGLVVPMLRPHEALLVLCVAALLARAAWDLRSGARPRPRVGLVAGALIAMAVGNSIVPLLWMGMRDAPISADDLAYAAVLWKFVVLFAVVRHTVRTEQEGRRCLWASMGVGGIVAVVAILQSLQLFGVDTLLETFYAPFGDTSVVSAGRGSATLGLAAATADLMIFNVALAAGWWRRYGFRPRLLAPLIALFVLGTLSSGQFSAAIGLVVTLVALGVVFRRADVPVVLGVAGVGAALLLAPVVSTRLAGFATTSGLPDSWVGRLDNLRGYFWPRLLEDGNLVFGVQPSARVPSPDSLALPWIWIESGYTWLLWGGGIPLLAAFIVFVVVTARWSLALARRPGFQGVAATGVFIGVVVIAVLMLFDPHITYRGSADLFFMLLGLAAIPRAGAHVPVRPGAASDPSTRHPEVEP